MKLSNYLMVVSIVSMFAEMMLLLMMAGRWWAATWLGAPRRRAVTQCRHGQRGRLPV